MVAWLKLDKFNRHKIPFISLSWHDDTRFCIEKCKDRNFSQNTIFLIIKIQIRRKYLQNIDTYYDRKVYYSLNETNSEVYFIERIKTSFITVSKKFPSASMKMKNFLTNNFHLPIRKRKLMIVIVSVYSVADVLNTCHILNELFLWST